MDLAIYWKDYRKRKKEGTVRPISYRIYNREWLDKNKIQLRRNEDEPCGWEIWKYHDYHKKWNKLTPAYRAKSANKYANGERKIYEVSIGAYDTPESSVKHPMQVGVATLVWCWYGGCVMPGEVIDHINNNCTDNRIENLQVLSRSDNTKKNSTGHNQYTPPELLKWNERVS